jgi:hypothetical protein
MMDLKLCDKNSRGRFKTVVLYSSCSEEIYENKKIIKMTVFWDVAPCRLV